MESIGGYRIIRPLAAGEFGSVILVSAIVKEEGDGPPRPVVLKIIQTDTRDPPTSEYDILRAFRLGLVPHTVHAVGRVCVRTLPADLAKMVVNKLGPQDNKHVMYDIIAMQYVRGPTLRAYLESRATLGLTTDDTAQKGEEDFLWVRFTRQLTAFAYHAYKVFGVGHGDLKLGNVIVETDNITGEQNLAVVDLSFGRRYAIDEHSSRLHAWQQGTMCYMAPERLFYVGRPPWIGEGDCAAAAANDVWSIGVIMSTMALTGLGFARMDKTQQLAVLDDAQRFNPGFTDTTYDLLSAHALPWFHSLVSFIVLNSNLPKMFVEQAVRMVLWARALEHECTPFYYASEQYECVRGSARFTALSFYLENVYSDYEKYGKRIFEVVIANLQAQLGAAFTKTYLLTQQWDPRKRGPSDNPFRWLRAAFGEEEEEEGKDDEEEREEDAQQQQKATTRVKWADVIRNDVALTEGDDDNLTTLFTGLSFNFCCACGAATAPHLRRTKYGERICQVCALIKT